MRRIPLRGAVNRDPRHLTPDDLPVDVEQAMDHVLGLAFDDGKKGREEPSPETVTAYVAAQDVIVRALQRAKAGPTQRRARRVSRSAE